MRLFDKIKITCFIIILILVGYTAINSTIQFKKETRQFKEEILLNHNFNKSEIHFLLDY